MECKITEGESEIAYQLAMSIPEFHDPLSKEVFDKTLEKYKEGISSNLELIQVHNQYLGTQSEYFISMSNLLNSKNSLDRLLNNY